MHKLQAKIATVYPSNFVRMKMEREEWVNARDRTDMADTDTLMTGRISPMNDLEILSW